MQIRFVFGTQISLVTKSGTNHFHGSLLPVSPEHHYHRQQLFNDKASVSGSPLQDNSGGALGGPIKKNKLFFFANYEGFRQASSTTVVREVPLPTLGQGIVVMCPTMAAGDPTCPAGTPARGSCLTTTKISAGY